MNDPLTQAMRWKVILSAHPDSNIGQDASETWQRRAEALSFLYDREYQSRNVRPNSSHSRINQKDRPSNSQNPSDPKHSREGGLAGSALTIPEWINEIHELFPKKTIERLEKDALERYRLEEMITDPDLLSRAEPSLTLLKAVLRTKHLMNQAVLAMARQLVQKVIDQLLEKLAREVQSPFLGTLDRQHRSCLKIAKNFDPKATIHHNLSTYDPETKRLYIKSPHFYSRIRRNLDRWQLIILVDESGSMIDSIIHAAVTASIFCQLQQIRTHLCIFDTSIVDLTEQCRDPVETLMQVQLGGGTNIGQALNYAETLIDHPRNTIVVLITDFYEGAPRETLFSTTRRLIESGVTMLGLAALDSDANPNYDRTTAQALVNLGMHVGAMTPGELAEWIARTVRK
ncbi:MULTISPECIES: VWA domain-containing protein [Leptolyngbya]|uniref:VWA domain-containing protein n=1 Tax=Leptolyngbya TaxID=47251 RepID=UPI00168731A9|nr:VWA domain-containing protein [Leptolyngbya sp. FACHB-1624]MBD1854470.1 VWA domain-containing protein [Leptolyngbya sp. FACHB-1624]